MADDYVLPVQNDLHDGMAAARIAGYSWPEINQFVAGRQDAAAQVGYTPEEIQQHFGLAAPAGLNDRLRNSIQRNLAVSK
jgi:hypothetical protein